MRFNFTDNIPFADLAGNVRETSNGYLVAMPRVARSGIQIYSGEEAGHPEMQRVRVYRPPEQVFSKTSLATFSNKPITNDHPPVPVTADNWKALAAGQCGEDVLRDGETIRIPMIICDGAAIKDYRAGKRQISVGYTCDLKMEAGKTRGGEEYDAIQTNIAVNHVALVAAARGGEQLAFGDDQHESEDDMDAKLRTITVDGLTVQIVDTGADIVQRHIKRLEDSAADITSKLQDANNKVATLTTDIAKAASEAKVEVEKKDAEITTMRKQLADAKFDPAKLDKLVADRQIVIAKAKAVLQDVVIDGKSDADIRKQVVESKLGDACKGWDEGQIMASFASFTNDIDPDAQQQNGSKTNDAVTRMAFDFSRPSSRTVNDADKAYAERNEYLTNAHKRNKPGYAPHK